MSTRKTKACYYISAPHTLPETTECLTLAQAKKELARIAKAAQAKCKSHYRRCVRMGSVVKGAVEVRIGGRQGFHLWNSFAIAKR